MEKRNNEISFDEFGDCSSAIQKQFQNYVDAFEQAEWTQTFQVLVASGISLPPSGELSDADLDAKLWEIINALALMGAYLEHTDHLSNRELYILLLDDVLLEETVIPSPAIASVCHIDLIGSGSDEDNDTYLKYYADEDDRSLWLEEFPDEPMPSREPLPYDRDRRLPKPDLKRKLGVH
ncbi:MAG: hypothetical protein WC091_22105 [Sulfuricellaceae bacterium]